MANPLIGRRLKALREERRVSQDDLARLLGFKDRQTVSAIETGARRVTAEELVLAVEKLDVPLDYFTDPFQLIGEGRFSWRHTDAEPHSLGDYERSAAVGSPRTVPWQHSSDAKPRLCDERSASPDTRASRTPCWPASASPPNSVLATHPQPA